MNKEYRKQVASTILNQMGGKGFILMTGAHTITSRSHKECPALSFKYKMAHVSIYKNINKEI